MISSQKARAPCLGLRSTQSQGIQQNASTGNIEHATTLTYCQVITYTKSSIVFQINTVLQLWCQSIQPIDYRDTVFPSESNHSEGSKITFCYKVHFQNIFYFQLLSACCQSSPQTAEYCTQKNISQDTLCELLTRRLFCQVKGYTYRNIGQRLQILCLQKFCHFYGSEH